MRAVPVLTTLLAAIWLSYNACVALFTGTVFSLRADHPDVPAGEIAGLVLRQWTWGGSALALLVVLLLVTAAWAAWRDILRGRAGLLLTAALLLGGIHAGVVAANQVASERRDRLDEVVPRAELAQLDEERREAQLAFYRPHDLALDLYKTETVLLLIVMLAGTVLLIRRGGDGG